MDLLRAAVKDGNVTVVEQLIPRYKHNAQDLINVAIDKEQYAVISVLIPFCPNIRRALKWAIRGDKIPAVQLLSPVFNNRSHANARYTNSPKVRQIASMEPIMEIIWIALTYNNHRTLEFLFEDVSLGQSLGQNVIPSVSQSIVQSAFDLCIQMQIKQAKRQSKQQSNPPSNPPSMVRCCEVVISKLEYLPPRLAGSIPAALMGLCDCKLAHWLLPQIKSPGKTLVPLGEGRVVELYQHGTCCEGCAPAIRERIMKVRLQPVEANMIFKLSIEACDEAMLQFVYPKISSIDLTTILIRLPVPTIEWLDTLLRPRYDRQVMLKHAVDRTNLPLVHFVLKSIHPTHLMNVINQTRPNPELLQLLLGHVTDAQFVTVTAMKRKLEPMGLAYFKRVLTSDPRWCLELAMQLGRVDLVEAALSEVKTLDANILLQTKHPRIRQLLQAGINQFNPQCLLEAANANDVDLVQKLLPHITIQDATNVILSMLERQHINAAFKILYHWKDAQLQCPTCQAITSI